MLKDLQKKAPEDITIRTIPFVFDENIEPVWNKANHEWSHMVNGASLAMPYLEPFLIKSLREALPQLPEHLHRDVKGFVGQEAQHYTNHRKYNEMLKAHGYPELAEVEETMVRDYEKLSTWGLKWKLAYSAGFESMTMGVTEWLINHRVELFKDADPVVSSLVLWHMVEETEHKTVAFDVFQAVSGSYWLRVFGLLHGSFHVAFMSRRGYRAMLKKDGQWSSWRSRLRVYKMVAKFFIHAGPAMLKTLNPWHDPREVRDPDWVYQWRDAYQQLHENQLPMLNTGAEDIHPQFEWRVA